MSVSLVLFKTIASHGLVYLQLVFWRPDSLSFVTEYDLLHW